MNEDKYETAWSEPLPVDWNEWRPLWAATYGALTALERVLTRYHNEEMNR